VNIEASAFLIQQLIVLRLQTFASAIVGLVAERASLPAGQPHGAMRTRLRGAIM
jgi:hypothetical protein